MTRRARNPGDEDRDEARASATPQISPPGYFRVVTSAWRAASGCHTDERHVLAIACAHGGSVNAIGSLNDRGYFQIASVASGLVRAPKHENATLELTSPTGAFQVSFSASNQGAGGQSWVEHVDTRIYLMRGALSDDPSLVKLFAETDRPPGFRALAWFDKLAGRWLAASPPDATGRRRERHVSFAIAAPDPSAENPGDEDRDEARSSARGPARLGPTFGIRHRDEDSRSADDMAREVVVRQDAVEVDGVVDAQWRMGWLRPLKRGEDTELLVTANGLPLFARSKLKIGAIRAAVGGGFFVSSYDDPEHAVVWVSAGEVRYGSTRYGATRSDRTPGWDNATRLAADEVTVVARHRAAENPGDEDRDEARASHSRGITELTIRSTPCPVRSSHERLASAMSSPQRSLVTAAVAFLSGAELVEINGTDRRVLATITTDTSGQSPEDTLRTPTNPEGAAVWISSPTGAVSATFGAADHVSSPPSLTVVGSFAIQFSPALWRVTLRASQSNRPGRAPEVLATYAHDDGWRTTDGTPVAIGFAAADKPRENPGDEDRDEARASSTPARWKPGDKFFYPVDGEKLGPRRWRVEASRFLQELDPATWFFSHYREIEDATGVSAGLYVGHGSTLAEALSDWKGTLEAEEAFKGRKVNVVPVVVREIK